MDGGPEKSNALEFEGKNIQQKMEVFLGRHLKEAEDSWVL